MEFNETQALEQLVLQNHQYLLEADHPAILCFDPDGCLIPWEIVFAASPKDSFPSICPTPGIGYYAHLKRRVGELDAVVSEWEVRGPDWLATVQIHGDGPSAVRTHLNLESEGGRRFLRLIGKPRQ